MGFENALTLKMFLFQTINYYAAILYIAFFKGRFVGTPGNYNRQVSSIIIDYATCLFVSKHLSLIYAHQYFHFRILGERQEECAPGGCYVEISLQLAITLIGNQILAALIEAVYPLISRTLNWIKMAGCDQNQSFLDLCRDTYQRITNVPTDLPQYMKDFQLAQWTDNDLFYEYLEMGIQVPI